MLEEITSQIVNSAKNQVESITTKIEFDEDKHEYKVEGKVLPSVSSIMSKMSKEYYSNIDPERLNKAADRGTRVHKAVEMYELYGIETDDPEVKPYLRNYKVAKHLNKFEVVFTELRLTNKEFCGTLDQIAVMDNKLLIIDLKATSKINTELLQVQLAAYLELARFNGIEVEGVFVLHLTKTAYKLKQIGVNDILWQSMKENYHEKV